MSEPLDRLTPGSLAWDLIRATQLRRASEHLGQKVLAEKLGIETRSLRAKIYSDRGITDENLLIAAAAVEAGAAEAQVRATAMLGLAASIRERLA